MKEGIPKEQILCECPFLDCEVNMKKRILCYGDSNTWGYDAFTDGRFPDEVRWTGQLASFLGQEYTVIEEGLCGRTTVFEDPLNEGMSGLSYLYPCIPV